MTISNNKEPVMASKSPEDNLFIFPMLKRFEDGTIDPTTVAKEKLEKLAFHYTRQIIHNTELQGFELDAAVFRDFDLVFQALKSAFMRASSQFHPLQVYTDELYTLEKAKNMNQPEPSDNDNK